jgi:hypothetical protein
MGYSTSGELNDFVRMLIEADSYVGRTLGDVKNCPKRGFQCQCDGSCETKDKFPVEEAIKRRDSLLKEDVITNTKRAEKEMMKDYNIKGYPKESVKEAYKETKNKLFYELDWGFITQMAERMASNKKEGKYELFNWKKPMTPEGIDHLKQATLRHLLEILQGRYEDDGREFGHLESLADNVMMINYQLKNNKNR